MGIGPCFRQLVYIRCPSATTIILMPAARSKKGKKSKAAAASLPAPEPSPEPISIPEPEPVEVTTVDDNAMQTDQPEPSSSTPSVETPPADAEREAVSKLTIEERQAKLDELRRKMVRSLLCPTLWIQLNFEQQAASSKANRSSLVEEAAKAKITARDAARLERQRKLAEMLRTKADAVERGEDVERQKNWEYTIEENDE